ncbi:hypothetical protein [Methylotuvimicrobium buryatense]|uniref:Uncharacterized protein n=1 Tax=Methylotuvimicrobium buryatense TaxID=95641 RepID=A0A4P9UW64_METBY|nr:hypothetical protein [Methylotuvimicrobium buryatense]QCW83986.1 hypothetical protein EQU24_18360 [Methylotuvimicrobium buryatense]
MKTLCITGAIPSQIDLIASIFEQAGMSPAQDTNKDPIFNIHDWHDHVLTNIPVNTGTQQHSQEPGRLWEQLASEIFIANLNSPLWGWADTNSTWLLDYWTHFDPNIRFVLACTSPEQMLAEAVRNSPSDISADAVLQSWKTIHQTLLRFHLRHPDRSILIMADEGLSMPSHLIDAGNERWHLQCAPLENDAFKKPDTNEVALFIGQQIYNDQPQINSLSHEIAASIIHLGPTTKSMTVSIDIAIGALQSLQEKAALALKQSDQLHTLNEANQALTQDRDKLEIQNEALESELQSAKDQLQSQAQEFKTQLDNQTQENELLLLQLHQVQEELESLFIKSKEQTTAFDQQAKELQKLNQAHQSLLNEKSQLEALSKSYASERDKLAAQSKAAQSELQNLKDQLQSQAQENELLLLQLHQVQEELEHYFLQHQEAQNQLQTHDKRWQRILQRHPDYCDYETLECSITNQDTVAWRFTRLNVAGRYFDRLEFETLIEAGVAGFNFKRQPDNSSNLTRWPASAEQNDQITVIPVGDNSNAAIRTAILRELAASDWNVIRLLPSVLTEHLTNHLDITPIDKALAKTLCSSLKRLQDLFDQIRSRLRFDNITIKREQVNPDYEHLWFDINNLSFNDRQYPEFQFRLSCAIARPDHFGEHPKLEFPESTGPNPLQTWFAESYDDFGPKLELRFAPPQALDINVWNQLGPSDQSFILALINLLPTILLTLRTNQAQISRSWDDWLAMIKAMLPIIKQQATPVAALSIESPLTVQQTGTTEPTPKRQSQTKAQARSPRTNK